MKQKESKQIRVNSMGTPHDTVHQNINGYLTLNFESGPTFLLGLSLRMPEGGQKKTSYFIK